IDLDTAAPRSLDGSIGHDETGHDLRRAQSMNFSGVARITCGDELVQFGYQRRALVNGAVGKSKPAVECMERRAKPIVSIRPGDALDLAVPIEMSHPLEGFADDGFFIVDLFRVADVLPVAAAFGFVIGTGGSLTIRRSLE